MCQNTTLCGNGLKVNESVDWSVIKILPCINVNCRNLQVYVGLGHPYTVSSVWFSALDTPTYAMGNACDECVSGPSDSLKYTCIYIYGLRVSCFFG